ncbi:hypothetical protein M514_11130 [Trichuris suis]|uniref:Zinc finger domain-containing protein n=1 Tax=Trichuris suis TaxID=68888 RepID=A0A085N173_9BILA|nr:hypothetical protein M513_11130 [Trichuris suis]KFD63219.1 hypothetical protein M514_11130 [Trichuris suis]KHJ41874.1 hypothetical protein D918_08090 [Trichuris suis]
MSGQNAAAVLYTRRIATSAAEHVTIKQRIRTSSGTQPNWAHCSVTQDSDAVAQLKQADSLEELRELLKPRRPPPGYYCHICFSTEHYINCCPVGLNFNCNTPYKGHKKSIGLFVCPKCMRKWTSKNSYAGMSEKCLKCHLDTLPIKQYPMCILTNPKYAHLKEYVTNFSTHPNASNFNPAVHQRNGLIQMAGNQHSSIAFGKHF